MNRQQIRPSLADLTDYEDLAFPEYDSAEPPAVTVSRTAPPNIINSSTLPKILEGDRSNKPKSRFAIQREREAAAVLARKNGTERFEIDLDQEPELPALPQLVGEVIERESDGLLPTPPTFSAPSVISPLEKSRGFPSVFKAAVIPRREKIEETIPISRESLPSLFESVNSENDGIIAGMSEEEILKEQRMIREEMGLSAAVLKMLEGRDRQKLNAKEQQQKTVRFKAMETISIEEEEGTPEYIRKHFFPNEPPSSENANLDWMREGSSSTLVSDGKNLPTFDMSGKLVLSTPSANHEGHDHHGSSSNNFTIPSLLTLVSSTVSAQRSTAFLIISRILRQPPSLNKPEWEKFRLEACRSAGWGMRDKHVGTSTAAIDVLEIIFEQEEKARQKGKKVALFIEGMEALETTAQAFLTTNPYPSITRHFQFNLVPRQSLDGLVRILQYLVLDSAGGPKSLVVEELVASPSLLEAITKKCIGIVWPPQPTESPASALSLLSIIAKSSRDRARALSTRKLVETPLRFFSILPWEMDENVRGLAYQALEGTIELWSVLGRYGFGTTLRTKGSSLFAGVFSHFDSIFSSSTSIMSSEELQLAESWFKLLSIWTVAAIDPHSTEHDIVWTQIDWQSNATDAQNWILENEIEGKGGMLASIWEVLAVWLEGSKVNKSWKGEEERKWLFEMIGGNWAIGGKVFKILEGAIKVITLNDAESHAQLILSAVRLSNAYEESTSPATPHLLCFNQSLLTQLYSGFHEQRQSKPNWSSIRALVTLLPFVDDKKIRLFATLDILPYLGPGDEVTARMLTNAVLANVETIDLEVASLERPALVNAPILRPFVLHAIITASAGRMVGPLQPESKDLLLTTSQRPFNGSSQLLKPDWPLFVLNELLRSGTSPVFENLPRGWNASELELVQAGLGLMTVIQLSKHGRADAALLIYDLIKVFMLEKDDGGKLASQEIESDLFRDEIVQISMEEILKPLMIKSQLTQIRSRSSSASMAKLQDLSTEVSSAPFYSLYTDLVGLYDSISLAHPIFAQVMLPPLAMCYPIDYRRLLWMDYSHLLKTIQIDLNSVISENPGNNSISSYLYPVEENQTILHAYCEALVIGKVTKNENGFLYFVALHHVTSTVFSSTPSELAARLGGSIIEQGSKDLISDLLRFTLTEKEGDEITLSPACYAGECLLERRKKLDELIGPQ